MLEHTFPLNSREWPVQVTDDEAIQLHDKGFRFSIFRPGREQCRLSLPYETTIDRARGTVTFRQPEEEMGTLTVRHSKGDAITAIRSA